MSRQNCQAEIMIQPLVTSGSKSQAENVQSKNWVVNVKLKMSPEIIVQPLMTSGGKSQAEVVKRNIIA